MNMAWQARKLQHLDLYDLVYNDDLILSTTMTKDLADTWVKKLNTMDQQRTLGLRYAESLYARINVYKGANEINGVKVESDAHLRLIVLNQYERRWLKQWEETLDGES